MYVSRVSALTLAFDRGILSAMQLISAKDIIRRIEFENPWWGASRSVSESHSRWKPRPYLKLFFPLVKDLDSN